MDVIKVYFSPVKFYCSVIVPGKCDTAKPVPATHVIVPYYFVLGF